MSDDKKEDAEHVGEIAARLTPQEMAESVAGAVPENPDADWAHKLPQSYEWLQDKVGFDDKNTRVFRDIATYFCRRNVGATRKAIIAMGPPGTGKTHLMRGLAALTGDRIYRAQELVDLYCDEKRGRQKFQAIVNGYRMGCKYFYLDDLNKENQAYGFELMPEVIDIWWNLYILHGHRMYITTELNLDEIEKRYGESTRSRIEGMCQQIVFDGPDRRKENI